MGYGLNRNRHYRFITQRANKILFSEHIIYVVKDNESFNNLCEPQEGNQNPLRS